MNAAELIKLLETLPPEAEMLVCDIHGDYTPVEAVHPPDRYREGYWLY